MPKTKAIADILKATDGDLRRPVIEKCGFGYSGVRRFYDRIDQMGLTKKVPPQGQRVLAVPLAAAIAAVGDARIVTYADRRDKGKARNRIAANDVMRLLHDPSGFFSVARGAAWATSQVLPPYPYEPDEDEAEGKDEWAVGTRFQRVIDGEPQGIYEYDGEAVVEVSE